MRDRRETHFLDDAQAATPTVVAKVRKCLICRRTFQSEWAGERVCRKCKATAAWRSG